MKKLTAIPLSIAGAALVVSALGMPSLASAQTPPEASPTAAARTKGRLEQVREKVRERVRNAEVAIAFGRLQGTEEAVIDFRAAEGAEQSRGHLRFWTEDDGFYNGASRKVEINGQNVHAEGAGPLTKPDGTRVRVRFTLDLNGATDQVTVKVTGEGVDYTLTGTIEGRVFVGKLEKPAS